jgi:uroporphyrinogen-III synthase
MSSEIGELVRRLGGTPVLAPSVREIPHEQETARFVDALVGGEFSTVVFLTGSAATAILRSAESRGVLDGAVEALRRSTLVCRGPKPTAVVKRHGLSPDLVPAKPYTTPELLVALDAIDLEGRRVAVAHYGERNAALDGALVARGANVTDVCPYEWALPEDVGPLENLARNPTRLVDAMAFTSQIQVRNLFAVAREAQVAERLAAAMNADIIVAAVGPVCADALKEAGVTPDVQPAEPKMGPLLHALADYIELTSPAALEEEE